MKANKEKTAFTKCLDLINLVTKALKQRQAPLFGSLGITS